MKPHKIKEGVYWVGAVDYNSRDFHGYSKSPMGTTYNAYLVIDDKITLFDTVKSEFTPELFCAISHVVDLEKIDYVVVNHLEPDHSGALPEIIERVKPEKVFCSPMGKRAMDAHYHQKDWPVEVVKTGDSISLGQRTVKFIETRMLHWPDSMSSYVVEDGLLICNDAFGQNIACTERYADEVDRSMLEHIMQEYYANIVLPYSPVVIKTLDALAEMDLDIQMILPDHGLMFRGEDCQFALDSYRRFAEQIPRKKAVIIFDTMWHSTEKMAHAIRDGLEEEGINVEILWLKANHHSRVMTQVWDSAAVIVGSPTHNNGIMPNVAKILQYMKGLRPQNKIGAAFGSFGWSGESVKVISEWMEEMKFELPENPVKHQFVPDHSALKACADLGRAIGKKIHEKWD